MNSPTSQGELTANEWRRLADFADRLEKAWQGSDAPDLTAILPAANDPLRSAALLELVKTELEIRWRRKQGVLLESYLERFPELGDKDHVPASLVYEEFRVRQRYGDHGPLETYRDRFPRQFDDLQRLVREQPVPTIGMSQPATPGPAQAAPKVVAATAYTELMEGTGYQREKLIGRGGFGEVWKAIAPGGVPVAVKIISRTADQEERQREERALEVIKKLTHHFLVRTHSYYTLPDKLMIVMDLADGSLRDRQRECRKQGDKGIPPRELLHYFKQSAEALDYLHSKDVMHRDIKPDNILLVEGHARLADFGLARHQDQQQVSVSGSGTPAYMAPEVWRGKAGRRSDQYSLAYAYAELRMGRRPFSSTDFAAIMFDHLDHVPDLEGIPAKEQQVLMKGLAKKPEDRFATCGEFVAALEKALWTTETVELPHPHTVEQASSKMGAGSDAVGTPGTPPLPTQDDLPPEVTATLLPQFSGQRSKDAPTAAVSTRMPFQTAPRREARRRFLAVGLLGAGAAVIAVVIWLVMPKTPAPPPQSIPEGFRAGSDATQKDFRQRELFKVLVCDRPGRPPVRFLLVPQERETDVPSFYLMETKVSNDVYAAFLAPEPVSGKESWPNGDEKGHLPALGVKPDQAVACAQWLGGSLPTTDQWDRAFGLGQDRQPDRSNVAVGRRGQGSLPVDAPGDKSPFGILGMAGNGTELTRNLLGGGSLPADQVSPDALVILRGQRLEAAQPLTAAELEQQRKPEYTQVQFYGRASPFTGFRVAVDLPAK